MRSKAHRFRAKLDALRRHARRKRTRKARIAAGTRIDVGYCLHWDHNATLCDYQETGP